MQREKSFSPETRFTFDLLRIFASQLVLFGHAISFFGAFPRIQADHGGIDVQNLAVVIFFLLSGALITKSLFRAQREQDFPGYFLSRFTRIYTSFLPCLLFIAVLDYGNQLLNPGYGYRHGLKQFFGNLLMLQDFPVLRRIDISSYGSGRPLWTLAVEWWIYLFMGLAFFLFTTGWHRIRHKVIFSGALMFSSIVALYNLFGGRGHGLTLTWLLGSFVYLLLPERSLAGGAERRREKWIVLLCAAAVSAALYVVRAEYDLRMSLALAALFGSLLYRAQRRAAGVSPRAQKVGAFLASYSFTLYLVHYSILDFLFAIRGEQNAYVMVVWSFVACNLVSILIAFATERHHEDLKRKIASSPLWARIRAWMV